MPKPFNGAINLDIRDSTPDWQAFLPDKAPDGVRLVLARDIGQVRDVLRRAGSDDDATVFPTVDDAVNRVR